MTCGTRSGEGRRNQHKQRRQNKPRTICLRRLEAGPEPDSMCQHRVGLAGPSSRSFLSSRHQQHFAFSYSRKHHSSRQRDHLVQPIRIGKLHRNRNSNKWFAISHDDDNSRMGIWTSGWVVLPDDKLRLLLDYLPTLSSSVVLAVGTVGLWRSKGGERTESLFDG